MKFDRAAEILVKNRLSLGRLDGLPKELRPATQAEGYAIQTAVERNLTARGWGARAGYKIGCTTHTMQTYLKIQSPCAGTILENRVYRSPAKLDRASFVRPGVECEMAVRLGAALPASFAPFDRHKVADAVEACMAAIEVVDDRYQDWRTIDTPTLIADDFFQTGIVLGPERLDWRTIDLAAMAGRMTVDGSVKGEGRGRDVMEHPFAALAWLADSLASRGRSLRQGDIVMTGSIVQTQWIEGQAEVAVELEGLGRASLRFV
jgi:2-keto-4-pentenoate hydratase